MEETETDIGGNDGGAPNVQRKVIHIDMDAFYASVEQRDNAELRGKPVAVGSSAARGVVAAASYEARAFGVRSALPSVTAMRRCPDLIFVPPRFDVYRVVSAQIREIFSEHTDLIEPLSLDEAYLDVTVNKQNIPIAMDIAMRIRARIKEVTGLNASAGISYCKFLAKMASDINKPNGQAVITPKNGPAYVESLPVKKFHGVGPATAAKMERLGILTGADLKARPLPYLQQHFGKAGSWYYNIARGIDNRQVNPDRERKSVGAEDTFAVDIADLAEAKRELEPLVAKVWGRCEAHGMSAKTVTVKIRFADFQIITRSRTVPTVYADRDAVLAASEMLLEGAHPFQKKVRLLGVTLSSFEQGEGTAEAQLEFRL
jgi:DNA polymerase-4